MYGMRGGAGRTRPGRSLETRLFRAVLVVDESSSGVDDRRGGVVRLLSSRGAREGRRI
jgi:hypothetical protein